VTGPSVHHRWRGHCRSSSCEARELALPHGARRCAGISRLGPSAQAHSGEVVVRFAARMRLLNRRARLRRPKATSRIARSVWPSARATKKARSLFSTAPDQSPAHRTPCAATASRPAHRDDRETPLIREAGQTHHKRGLEGGDKFGWFFASHPVYAGDSGAKEEEDSCEKNKIMK
jgi:hypothetical protein